MGVTRDDVRRMSALARVGIPDDRLDTLARELDGILAHMATLQQANATISANTVGMREERGIACEPDTVGPEPQGRPVEAFAPMSRNGFFLVPRLGTHDGAAGVEGGP